MEKPNGTVLTQVTGFYNLHLEIVVCQSEGYFSIFGYY